MDHKDPMKTKAACLRLRTRMDKEAYKKRIQSQSTIYRNLTNMKPGQGPSHLTIHQIWARDSSEFLWSQIVRFLTAKSTFNSLIEAIQYPRNSVVSHNSPLSSQQ